MEINFSFTKINLVVGRQIFLFNNILTVVHWFKLNKNVLSNVCIIYCIRNHFDIQEDIKDDGQSILI